MFWCDCDCYVMREKDKSSRLSLLYCSIIDKVAEVFRSGSASCHLIGNDLHLMVRFCFCFRATNPRFRRNVAAFPPLFFFFQNVAYIEEAFFKKMITVVFSVKLQ